MKLIEKIEAEQLKKEKLNFNIGDSVKVHTRVREGEKERVQIFAGVVIARRGRGMNENVTVRRISYGEGVERVFPIHSPRVEKIEVERPGKARRAKLYYLRGRKGKEALAVKDSSAKDREKAQAEKTAAKAKAKSAPKEEVAA